MKNITENNKLIAEFMGAKIDGITVYAVKEFPTGKEGWKYRVDTYLHFNDSWDWIMPVVEKIYNHDKFEYYTVFTEDEAVQFFNNNIKYIYDKVVEFIEWNNG